MNVGEILTVQEVADYLKVKAATVRRWIREGQLQAYRFGNSWRISKDQLDEFMEKNKGKGSAAK
jgi:excisionase family DNA binding protein